MMTCRKCGGRVYLDRAFCSETNIELACLICGKRWMLDPVKNIFGRYIRKIAII